MRVETRNKICCFVALVLLVGAGLFRIWVYQDVLQIGYKLSAAQQRSSKRQTNLKQLELELAAEKTPKKLIGLADALGLRQPKHWQIVAYQRKKGSGHGKP
jgi:cell division protein FtsL